MKKIIIFISIVSLFFWFIFDTFALNAPWNLKVVSSKDNTVNLSWDKVDKAYMYSVYYSKIPWAEKAYDNQTDYLETNTTEIKKLSAWTYYFSVVALNDLWEESTFWKEISVEVKWSKEWDFILKSINVASLNWIELSFSAPLENIKDAIREFKIVNKKDPADTYEVTKTEVNPDDNTKILLTLDRDTKVWNEYEVTVIAIKSLNGKNIESWIDSTEVFVVKNIDYSKPIVKNVETTKAKTINNSGAIQLNSANQASKITNDTGTWIELLAAAEVPEKLPVTWTEHILLLLASMILWLWFFIFKIKRS